MVPVVKYIGTLKGIGVDDKNDSRKKKIGYGTMQDCWACMQGLHAMEQGIFARDVFFYFQTRNICQMVPL